MATPSPISAMRNFTMMLTSVNVVSSSTSMNVVRIDTRGDEQRQ